MAWRWKQWPWSTPNGVVQGWEWPERDELQTRLNAVSLPGPRVVLLVDFLCRIERKRSEASLGASSSHWIQRASAGLSAAAATLTGGTLLSSWHSHAAVAIGGVSAGIGVISSGIIAAHPDASYAANQTAKSAYEKLYWDVYGYAITTAKGAGADDFNKQLEVFTTTFEATMAQAPAPSAAVQKQ